MAKKAAPRKSGTGRGNFLGSPRAVRAVVRVDSVLVLGGALVLGGLSIVAPSAAAFATIALVALLARRTSGWALAWAFVALLVTAARALTQVTAFESALAETRATLSGPRRCAGIATVETSPVRHAESLGYVARFGSLDCEGRMLEGTRARLHGGPVDLGRGDQVEIVAQLATVELFQNAELPDPTPRAARTGAVLSGAVLSARVTRRAETPQAFIDRARATVRARIDATFPLDAAPLARALVLGENDLPDEEAAAFRASGLSHLLAVSGTHLVFAVLGIVHAMAFLLVRFERLSSRCDVRRVAAVFGAVLAPVYADFAGGSGSAWRAAVMLSIGLCARALGRAPSASRSFAWSLVIGALWDPLIGFDVSFLLSVSATAGLLLWGKVIARRLSPVGSGRARRAVGAATAATLSAMIPCTPLLATLGPRLTVAGVAANVIAAPFGEAVSLPLCLLHAVVPFDACQRGIGLVGGGALLVVARVARISAAATWLTVPVPPPTSWHFAVLGVGSVGALLHRFTETEAGRGSTCHTADRRSRAVQSFTYVVGAILGSVIIEASALRNGRPIGQLRVTVLDVGQGDSTLIDLPDGKLMLLDGGGFVGSPVDPGRSVILPLLRARRRKRIDVVVLSHPHPDHFLGLVSTLPEIDVGEFWDTGEGREHGAGPDYASLIHGLEARQVPLSGPAVLCGPTRLLGGAEITVLAPCPTWDPGLGSNDNSFIVRIRHRSRTVLLMGDAERDQEARLMSSGYDLRADLLKVGHHGSRTSTSAELVERVKPSIATVSTGARNRFGHPHASTLATLRNRGIRVLRTDLTGSAEWSSACGPETVRVAGSSVRERGWDDLRKVLELPFLRTGGGQKR